VIVTIPPGGGDGGAMYSPVPGLIVPMFPPKVEETDQLTAESFSLFKIAEN
jgi:hypothetical protein